MCVRVPASTTFTDLRVSSSQSQSEVIVYSAVRCGTQLLRPTVKHLLMEAQRDASTR